MNRNKWRDLGKILLGILIVLEIVWLLALVFQSVDSTAEENDKHRPHGGKRVWSCSLVDSAGVDGRISGRAGSNPVA